MGGVLQPLRQLECDPSVVLVLDEGPRLIVSLAKPFQQGKQSSLIYRSLRSYRENARFTNFSVDCYKPITTSLRP